MCMMFEPNIKLRVTHVSCCLNLISQCIGGFHLHLLFPQGGQESLKLLIADYLVA